MVLIYKEHGKKIFSSKYCKSWPTLALCPDANCSKDDIKQEESHQMHLERTFQPNIHTMRGVVIPLAPNFLCFFRVLSVQQLSEIFSGGSFLFF